jgi:hypothetical protein
MKPAVAGPTDAAFRGDLVADHQIAAVADAPEMGDGAQAEVVFLPAEEQVGVVTAGIVPGFAPDGMTGTDEGRGFEGLGGAGDQRGRISPGQHIVAAGLIDHDTATERAQIRVGVERCFHAGQRLGPIERGVVVQADDNAPKADAGSHVAPAGHAVIVIQRDQSGIVAVADRFGQQRQRLGPRSLIDDDDMAGHAGLCQGGADRGGGFLGAVEGEDHHVNIVIRRRRLFRAGDVAHARRTYGVVGHCLTVTVWFAPLFVIAGLDPRGIKISRRGGQ